MRNLQTQDVFKFMRIISAAGLKEDLKKFLDGSENKKIEAKEVGVDIVFMLLERAAGANTEQAIYEFLAGLFEKEAQEIAKMDLLELVTALTDGVDVENWKVFFKHVSALMTK